MRTELTRLRGAEEEAKNNANRVNTLLEELERLKKELHTTQKEKKTIEDWAQKYRDEMEKVGPLLLLSLLASYPCLSLLLFSSFPPLFFSLSSSPVACHLFCFSLQCSSLPLLSPLLCLPFHLDIKIQARDF